MFTKIDSFVNLSVLLLSIFIIYLIVIKLFIINYIYILKINFNNNSIFRNITNIEKNQKCSKFSINSRYVECGAVSTKCDCA